VIEQGWLARARRLPSPNFDARPPGSAVELLVVHNISLPPHQFGGPAVVDLFLDRLDVGAHPFYTTWLTGVRVSAHLYIRRDGELIQFVSCADRAWHAGVSEWRGRSRCNDFSIGIELEGSDLIPYRDVQYDVLTGVVRELRAVYPIADIVGHCDIAPLRKTDPGPFFDWERFRSSVG
jgi:AmpD protein